MDLDGKWKLAVLDLLIVIAARLEHVMSDEAAVQGQKKLLRRAAEVGDMLSQEAETTKEKR